MRLSTKYYTYLTLPYLTQSRGPFPNCSFWGSPSLTGNFEGTLPQFVIFQKLPKLKTLRVLCHLALLVQRSVPARIQKQSKLEKNVVITSEQCEHIAT